MSLRPLNLVFVLLLFLPACATSTPVAYQVETLAPSSTAIIFPTDTPTALPTSTGTPTPTPTHTATASPTPTLYVLAGTPLPPPVAPVVVENALVVSALAEWNEPAVVDMAWTPDGQILAVATQENIKLYDIITRQSLRTLYPVAREIVQIAFSPNGRWLVVGSRRGSIEEGYFSTLELWLGPDWKPLGILYDVPLALNQLAFSPDGASLALAFTSHIEDENMVQFISTINWLMVDELSTGTVLNIAFFPAGGLMAVSPDRYAVRIWDFNEEEWTFTQHTSFTGAVTNMTFSPDAATFGTAHYDGQIQMWDIETGEPLTSIVTEEVVNDIAFSPDGRLLASGGSYQNNYVRLWDVSTGTLLKTLEGHTDGVTQVDFSPDGQYLISASYNGQIILWGIRQ